MSLRASGRSAGRPTNCGGQRGDCLSWSCPAVNVTLLKRAPLSLSPRRPPSHLSCRLLVNSSPANRMETSTLGNEPVQGGKIESRRSSEEWGNGKRWLHASPSSQQGEEDGEGPPVFMLTRSIFNSRAHPVSETTSSDQWSFPALCMAMAPAVPDL